MKTFIISGILLLAAICLPLVSDGATLLLNTNVSGTAASLAYPVQNVYMSPQSFLFTSGGITNLQALQTNVVNGVTNIVNLITNAIAINIQYSVDPNNSNWITQATWNPNTTNSGEADNPQYNFNAITLYQRVQLVTTNPLSQISFKTP